MSDRIDTRSPLAYSRALRDDPEEALAALPELQRLSPVERRAVQYIREQSRDPEMAAALAGFLRSDELGGCDADHRAALLEALTREPTEKALGSLTLLAGDAEFRRMDPRAAEAEIRTVLHGHERAPSGSEAIQRAGIRRPREASFSLTQAVELGLHGAEIAVDIAVEHGFLGGAGAGAAGTAATAGTVAAAVLAPVAFVAGMYGVLHEIGEAHEQGARWRDAVQFGHGFTNAMAGILRGEEPASRLSGPRARGAAAAERFWEGLDPAQRVAIREHSQEFMASLRRSVEAATMRPTR